MDEEQLMAVDKVIPEGDRGQGGWPSYVAEIARLNSVVKRLNAELDEARNKADRHEARAIQIEAELAESRSLLAEGEVLVMGLQADRKHLREDLLRLHAQHAVLCRWVDDNVTLPDGGRSDG
jgi:hypothetical protein